jgi:2-polyprenyl-3-methyl-5-hydroxy-6-metoxy-1,4-benzoquinol methylase
MKESDIRPKNIFNRYLEECRKDNMFLLKETSGFIKIRCPGCGQDSYKPCFTKWGSAYQLCNLCGSLFLNPRVSQSEMDRVQSKLASINFWRSHFYRETLESRRVNIFQPRALIVRDTANRLDISPQSTFVDVGSGYGSFLEEIKSLNRFENIVGIEPDKELAKVCSKNGISILDKRMEDVGYKEISADFMTAFEVIEHLFDPSEFFEGVKQILRPGGLFLLTTLTCSGFDIQALWEHAKNIYPPHHINILSISGLEVLAQRCGFEIVEINTPGQLDVEILKNALLDNPDIPLSKFEHNLVYQCGEAVQENFQKFLQNNRLSSHVHVLLRRVDKEITR